mmetsp:Transcript_3846/g.5370  ORF Transcript_3846/g.5370 Transcript_3846/m.5370 type:complete len:675 (-) Transcript_3846:30-2054(-)
MGFLTEGSTFSWEEASISPAEFVRQHGIKQFLNIFHTLKERTRDKLRWGDEIEYIVVHLDEKNEKVFLSLRGHEIIDKLAQEEHRQLHEIEEAKKSGAPNGLPTLNLSSLWRPEYAKYMVEGTPGGPFGAGGINDLLKIEDSMRQRRELINTELQPDERIVTMPNFPLLGAIQSGPYTYPHYAPGGPVACSHFTPDDIIHPHFRFRTLTANIRKRKGSKVEIAVPLYQDVNTTKEPLPILPPSTPYQQQYPLPDCATKPNTIYADSMAFGMGCCCLQTTFQCCNIEEARHFYDQLAVLSPIMLALSAGTPFVRGYLAETDARWNIIAASVDDRTLEERGMKPLKQNKFVINKSRYDSIDCFLSLDSRLKKEYNDLDLVYDKEICQTLMQDGVDELLSRHIAHLFIRDPLVIYRDKLAIDDTVHVDHFENIQSTNWQTVRFKPPPPNSQIGWRVEFRPMEIQLTDFENAAFVVFIVLLTRVIGAFDLNFYIPISKVDENMQTSQKRGAVTNEKFWFRKSVDKDSHLTETPNFYELMTINEIMNGKQDGSFPGLIPLTFKYINALNLPTDIHDGLSSYLSFISKKASGELLTTAAYLRKLVVDHPEYNKDSVVSTKIAYDVVQTAVKIGSGELHPEELLGNFTRERKPIITNVNVPFPSMCKEMAKKQAASEGNHL